MPNSFKLPLEYLKADQYHFYTRNDTDNDNYLGSDTKDRFKSNLKNMPYNWKYITKKVIYKFNKSGFRTYEFDLIDWKNSIVILGCSCTFGIGVAEDETINYHLENLTNKPVINLGISGISNHVIIDMLSYIINNFEIPTNIIINWTALGRFTYYFPDASLNCGSWTSVINSEYNNVNLELLYNAKNYHESNSFMETYLLGQVAKALSLNRFNLINCSFFTDTAYCVNGQYFVNDHKARDLLHPSSENYQEVANYIYKNLV